MGIKQELLKKLNINVEGHAPEINKQVLELKESVKIFDKFDLEKLEPTFHLDSIDETSLREDVPINMDNKYCFENAIDSKDGFVVVEGDLSHE